MKNKKLTEKVELFYRLASYGNRSNFLKAIAQESPMTFPGDNLGQLLQELSIRLNNLSTKWEDAEQKSVPEAQSLKDYARSFEKYMQSRYLMGRSELDEASQDLKRFVSSTNSLLLKVPASMQLDVKTVKDALDRVDGGIANFYRNVANLPYESESSKSIPDQTAPKAPAPAPAPEPAPQSFPVKTQEQLNELAMNGEIFLLKPLELTGKLDKPTQDALNSLKKKLNLSETESAKNLINIVENRVNLGPKNPYLK